MFEFRLQLPVYKRDIRSVITASYETAEWTFSGPCTLRCRINHLRIEMVLVASTKVDETVIVRSAKDLTVDMIRSMTETGRRLGPVGGPSKSHAADASALSPDFDFDAASSIEQTQRLYSSLKQQVIDLLHCPFLRLYAFHNVARPGVLGGHVIINAALLERMIITVHLADDVDPCVGSFVK